MLHFGGSDCKRSVGSTWYGRMDRLLITLGFTESKEDSKICFKIEGRRPMMLLLYDLFLTGKEELIRVARRRLVVKF